MLLILDGGGSIRVDFAEYDFDANALLSFGACQPFMVSSTGQLRGWAIHFHPDFFCIHKHQQEVACNGVLFNNIYEAPVVKLDDATVKDMVELIGRMQTEMQNSEVAQYELLVSYLKILLITASRIKIAQSPRPLAAGGKEPFVLQNFKEAIEKHYKTKHSAGDYAGMLHISTKSLARLSKNHFNKTPTSLIAERLVIEAKRELYLTAKPVKAIAYELGFNDEYYFSRFFKSNTDVSPQLYRDTVGFARG
jgi:AraC family transcriptional activator of pobA